MIVLPVRSMCTAPAGTLTSRFRPSALMRPSRTTNAPSSIGGLSSPTMSRAPSYATGPDGAWAVTRTQRKTEATKKVTVRLIICVLRYPLCPCIPAASPQHLHDLFRFKSLCGEKAVQTLELAIVRDRFASAQALLQRRVDQRLLIDGVEDLVDGTFGDGLVDASALNLQLHAQF